MRPVWGLGQHVLPLVRKAANIPRLEGQALGVVRGDGELIGGFVFNEWQPEWGTIQVHAASLDRRWVNRAVMEAVAEYVFDQCGCQMVYARTTPDNRPVRRWAKALGGSEYTIPRMRGRMASEVICTVTEEAFRASKFLR